GHDASRRATARSRGVRSRSDQAQRRDEGARGQHRDLARARRSRERTLAVARLRRASRGRAHLRDSLVRRRRARSRSRDVHRTGHGAHGAHLESPRGSARGRQSSGRRRVGSLGAHVGGRRRPSLQGANIMIRINLLPEEYRKKARTPIKLLLAVAGAVTVNGALLAWWGWAAFGVASEIESEKST